MPTASATSRSTDDARLLFSHDPIPARARLHAARSAGGAVHRADRAGRGAARGRQPDAEQRRFAQRDDGLVVGREPAGADPPGQGIPRRRQAVLRLPTGRFATHLRTRGDRQPESAPAPRRGQCLRPGASRAAHHQAGATGAEPMTPRFEPRRRQRAFTLIELLVAITILAIVAVLGWRGLDGITRSRAALTATMEQTRGQQLAFAQMQNDLEQLATTAQLHGRVNLQALDGRITLVRTSLAENEPSRLQVVSYRLRDGVLTRRESNATRDLVQLDALWQSALGDTDPAPSVALQSGVEALTMRAWQNSAWQSTISNAVQSQTPPVPTPLIQTGPTGLEVSLRLGGQATPLIKIFLLGAV